MLAEQGQPGEAETLYLRAIDGGHVEALYNLALLYDGQGKTGEAEQFYRRHRRRPDRRAQHPRKPAEHDRPGEAEQLYQRAIDGDHVEALYNLAVLYDGQGKTDEAERLCRRAIDAGNITALTCLAVLLEEQD